MASNQSTFNICPMLHGVLRIHEDTDLYAKHTKALLNEIEPDGPNGNVQLGFTLPLHLFSFFKQVDDSWIYDEEYIKPILEMCKLVKRPVVFQLTCNHFARPTKLINELLKSPDNVMTFTKGPISDDVYFHNQIFPFTLMTDPELSVNHYRFLAIQNVIRQLQEFQLETNGALVGITLNGEVHHFYDDFFAGGGAEGDVSTTDYSAISITGFRNWLDHYFQGSKKRVSKFIGSTVTDWNELYPPSKSLHNNENVDIIDHIDTYAHGQLPVEGWCSPINQVKAIWILIDNKPVIQADLYVSRPDVAEAVDEIIDVHSGFRATIDYKKLPEGIHHLCVKGELMNGNIFVIGSRKIEIISSRQKRYTPGLNRLFKKMNRQLKGFVNNSPNGVRFWLDSPKDDLVIAYNPLAELWHSYREYQVENYLTHLTKIALSTNIDANMVFSHQIYIPFFGRRTDFLYATGKTLQKNSLYNKGLNLYGGQTFNKTIAKRLSKSNYAVTEFHPLAEKDKNIHAEALHLHRKTGAHWISPFFLSPFEIINPHPVHSKFWIQPNNRAFGSHYLYQAMKDLCQH